MGVKTFTGGYKFKRFRGAPQDRLVPLPVPSEVVIPLSQGFGTPLAPLVKVGDQVEAGQIIACDNDIISSPIHSSIKGRVTSIEKKNYFMREIDMVTVAGDGLTEYQKLAGSSSAWQKLSSEELQELLYKSGVTSLEKSGIPTYLKSSIVRPDDIGDLIIHGSESEVYSSSLEVLLGGKNLFGFIEGIKILKKIMPQAKIRLALNSKRKDLIEKLTKLTSTINGFEVYPIISKYPQGYDEVLIPTLLKKDFPHGYSAANIGIIVLNIQAVVQAYEAVAEGTPLIERTVALCGPSFKDNVHIKVRVGTPLSTILKGRLKDPNSRIILNSLLTGPELKDLYLPVDRTFSQIIAIPENADREFLAFLRPGFRADSYSETFLAGYVPSEKLPDTNIYGEERPCIQCGYCISVCPVRIIPTILDRQARVAINETLLRFGIFKCIDCNLCSYVCPSKIPLARNLKIGKAKLIETGCDHSLCIAPKFNLKGLEEYRGVKAVR